MTLYEIADRIGGHSNTVDAVFNGRTIPVDTGFIVYNTHNYPNLVGLFDHLKIDTLETDMSFSVSLENKSFEYEGSLGVNSAAVTFCVHAMANAEWPCHSIAMLSPKACVALRQNLGQFIERCALPKHL